MKNLRVVSITILVLGGVAYFAGVIFKILHWPYGSVLHTFGPVVMMVGGLLFLISQRKSRQSG